MRFLIEPAMNPVSSIAASGMNAALTQLGMSAHHIANAQTPGLQRQRLELAAEPSGGVRVASSPTPVDGGSLEQDVVDQLAAKSAFMANLAVFKTADATMGALLSLRG